MKTCVLAGLLIVLAGCNRAPTLSGGKPVSHWVEALKDDDPAVRKKAAAKLGNAGNIDPAIVPALVTALHDPDPAVRTEVVLSLVKVGPEAHAAVPALTEMQASDADPQVRAHAARALERLQKGAKKGS